MPKSSVNASLSSYDDIFSTEESTYYDSPVLATIGGCISFVLCFIVMFLVGLIVFSHKKKIEN